MKTEKRTINNKEYIVIISKAGKVFQRIHDGFLMGNEIILGTDYSTGVSREDKQEYYKEIDNLEE